ncbi:Sin-like protein conserved region-domain-containing protein [Xylariales sp. PMI_506]|nr:Sin-like protein conserved region-domain-containing protein [Xylariales sp. PMI_506]
MDIDEESITSHPPAGPQTAASDDDTDPIVASYNVFTNPPPSASRKLLILQHPNKQGQQRLLPQALSEVRIKPGSGMIEVDVPMSYHDGSYDREKGMRWGQTLQRSMNQKNGGSHGLAGGFGVGVPAPRGGRRREEDRDTYDWSEAVRRDQVLRTQTLGGQFAGRNALADEECRWMVGVFKGGNLHLTPANSEIQLRPQLHHLDAATEQERLNRPRDGPGQGPGMGGPGGKDPSQPAAAPKAIHMTIKSSANGEQTTTETMADRLRHVQTESWQRLTFVDEDQLDAWELYNKTLLYRSSTAAAAAAAAGVSAKGKEKAAKLDEDEKEDLEKNAAQLRTTWTEEDLLRNVAGKDRDGVLEGYGSSALPGVKPGDVVEEGGAIKKEGGADGAAGGASRRIAAAATAAARAKGKVPVKGKAPTARGGAGGPMVID